MPDSILRRMTSARPGPYLHEACMQRLDVRKTRKVRFPHWNPVREWVTGKEKQAGAPGVASRVASLAFI